MTIEQNIIDLTAAVRELALAITKAHQPSIYTPYAPKAPAALGPLSPPVGGLTSPAAEAEKAAAAAAAPVEGVAPPAVSRDEVVAKFKTLAAKNRDAAVEVLKMAGVAKLSEVPDDKLAKVLDWIFGQSQR